MICSADLLAGEGSVFSIIFDTSEGASKSEYSKKKKRNLCINFEGFLHKNKQFKIPVSIIFFSAPSLLMHSHDLSLSSPSQGTHSFFRSVQTPGLSCGCCWAAERCVSSRGARHIFGLEIRMGK